MRGLLFVWTNATSLPSAHCFRLFLTRSIHAWYLQSCLAHEDSQLAAVVGLMLSGVRWSMGSFEMEIRCSLVVVGFSFVETGVASLDMDVSGAWRVSPRDSFFISSL